MLHHTRYISFHVWLISLITEVTWKPRLFPKIARNIKKHYLKQRKLQSSFIFCKNYLNEHHYTTVQERRSKWTFSRTSSLRYYISPYWFHGNNASVKRSLWNDGSMKIGRYHSKSQQQIANNVRRHRNIFCKLNEFLNI